MLVYIPNYSSCFPPGWYYKTLVLIWYLNETWKPIRWRSWQNNWKTYKRPTNKASRKRNSEKWWSRTTTISLGVSFETCLRRREDVLMRRYYYVLLRRRHDVSIRCRGDVPLRRFNDVPSRRRWVFHLRGTGDVARTYREMSLRRCHNVLLPGGEMLHFFKNNLFDLSS